MTRATPSNDGLVQRRQTNDFRVSVGRPFPTGGLYNLAGALCVAGPITVIRPPVPTACRAVALLPANLFAPLIVGDIECSGV